MIKRVVVLAVLLFAGLCVVAQQKSAPAAGSDQQAIRAQAEAWFKAGVAKNAEAFASYYAPDAHLLQPGGPIVSGKAKIRAFWINFFKQPGLAFSGGPTQIEAAKSSDLGYERGTFKLTINDASGKPVTSVGKYVVVWKKQPDGKWKAYADIFNADK